VSFNEYTRGRWQEQVTACTCEATTLTTEYDSGSIAKETATMSAKESQSKRIPAWVGPAKHDEGWGVGGGTGASNKKEKMKTNTGKRHGKHCMQKLKHQSH
jgi:hypothetical protein